MSGLSWPPRIQRVWAAHEALGSCRIYPVKVAVEYVDELLEMYQQLMRGGDVWVWGGVEAGLREFDPTGEETQSHLPHLIFMELVS